MQKETDDIPDNWSRVPLGKLMVFQNGFNTDKSAYGRGLRFANVMEVISHSHLVARDIPGRVSTTSTETSRYLVRTGDVLFNRTSETQEEVGLASVYLDEEPVLFGGFVLRGKLMGQDLHPRFAGYALRSSDIRAQIMASGQGGIRANVGQASLSAISLALPPLAEQEAIAEALSDADGAIDGLERLIAKKRRIKQGAMQDLLTATRRLPGFSGEWEDVRLTEIGYFKSGSGFPISAQGQANGDFPFFKVSDFSRKGNENRLLSANHYIDERVRKQLGATVFPAGAIAFAKIGAAIFLERKRPLCQLSCLDNNMAAFILENEDYSRDLLLASFQEVKLGELVSSTALPAISGSDLRALRFYLPRDPHEQVAIAEVLNDMDAEIAALESRLVKARLVKEGMMQNLLTGRIRLV